MFVLLLEVAASFVVRPHRDHNGKFTTKYYNGEDSPCNYYGRGIMDSPFNCNTIGIQFTVVSIHSENIMGENSP